jgi:cadmium resistance protein CadD (predicted permease)
LAKKKVGDILSVTSLLPVIISIIFFYTQRGPDFDIYLGIIIFGSLSIFGIIFAVISLVISRKRIFGWLGLIANVLVLVFAFLLQLAMGIGEP